MRVHIVLFNLYSILENQVMYSMQRNSKGAAFWRFVGHFFAVLGTTLLALVITVVGICWVLFKGPSPTARDLFTQSLMETSALKFVPSIFLSKEKVKDIIEGNAVIETDESTDTTTEFTEKEDDVDLQTIEVLNISGPAYSGKLMIVHDPSRVRFASLDTFGETIVGKNIHKFAEENNAVAAVNGGGFWDEEGKGLGGLPTGIVIRDGKLVYGAESDVTSLIGFDNNNRLIVGRMSAKKALDQNMRDAVSFGPAFIINGTPAEISGISGGVNPRTVVGQRADGAVLILVIDGRQPQSIGATYKDCIEVMMEHGAINAANLDGGTSTAMLYNGEIINHRYAFGGLRKLPTALIVV